MGIIPKPSFSALTAEGSSYTYVSQDTRARSVSSANESCDSWHSARTSLFSDREESADEWKPVHDVAEPMPEACIPDEIMTDNGQHGYDIFLGADIAVGGQSTIKVGYLGKLEAVAVKKFTHIVKSADFAKLQEIYELLDRLSPIATF